MQKVFEQTGIKPKPLEDATQCPADMAYLWDYFLELDGGRSAGGFSVNPISYQDIDCWNRLTNKNITANEVEIIKMIDNVFFQYQAKKDKDK